MINISFCFAILNCVVRRTPKKKPAKPRMINSLDAPVHSFTKLLTDTGRGRPSLLMTTTGFGGPASVKRSDQDKWPRWQAETEAGV